VSQRDVAADGALLAAGPLFSGDVFSANALAENAIAIAAAIQECLIIGEAPLEDEM